MTSKMYVDPRNNKPLIYRDNTYFGSDGQVFKHNILDIPDFTHPKQLLDSDQESNNWYKLNASDYDTYLPMTFDTFGVDEDFERQKMVDALEVAPGETVLEIGAGTGRDTIKIMDSLKNGKIYIQDISPEILEICINKLDADMPLIEKNFFLSNASFLPFPDNSIDRLFHFGGLNTFSERKRSIKEMVRVCKPGARIVIGDENMPIWLRDTEFGKVLMNSNPHYSYDLPLNDLPVEARNVKVEWIIGGVFYFISFDVGSGEPTADIDFKIPGLRGGSHRTRFYGQLEGVSSDAKEKIYSYARKSGKSVHTVLEHLISKLDN